jgi:hypothetical protein
MVPMNRKIVLVVLAVRIGAVAALASPVDKGQDEASNALAKLESLLSDHPALATSEVIELMEQAAETRRVDAAYLLIRGLAFNLNPDSSNESLGLADMIPAVRLLKDKYGVNILPILFAEAITAKEPWLRKRIAFTIREVAGRARVLELSEVFSLERSQAEGARDLVMLLAAKKIDIELYSPLDELSKKFSERLKHLDQQHQGPKTN